jgi:hypothetical protein
MRSLAGSLGAIAPFAIGLSILVAVAGCSSIRVTDQRAYEGEKLPRPDRIIVHNFAATPDDLPAWSEAAGRHAEPATPRTAEEVETGRELGIELARELVQKIQEMGLPAVRAPGEAPPREGDIVIVGWFESIDEGSAAKRVALGFGSGAAELTTAVEGYLMTEDGLRKLGSGVAASGAEKTPGVAVPLAVTAATANPIGLVVGGAVKGGEELTGKSTVHGVARRTADTIAEKLREGFQRQGWI